MKLWNESQLQIVINSVKEALREEQAIVQGLSQKKAESKKKELEVWMRHIQSHEKAKKQLMDRVMQEEQQEEGKVRPANKKPLTIEASYE